MDYVNSINPHALARRGGVPAGKANKDAEHYAKKLAARWAKRNLDLATPVELGLARLALESYGVIADGSYSAAASLLKRINLILSNAQS